MCRLLLITIALLLIFFGISGFWMMPKLLQRKIEQRMELKIGTQNYERFTRVPIPLTVKFYLFNVTNSEQVLAGLERPQFQEVGPFMYKQWRRRDIIDFEDNNRRIRYKEYKTFFPMFQNNPSNKHNSQDNNEEYKNPADFNVTIINVPLLSLLTKFAQFEDGTLKRSLVSKVASRLIQDGRDKILVTKPASQILFEGYKVEFMESARDLISSTLGFNFESPLPGNKFGFFYGKNGTWTRKENGELTIFTGRNGSMDDFFQIDNWNDLHELNVWPKNTVAGNTCNQIRGTDGSQFHPGVTRDQVLALFSPLVCRSLYIKYKEDTSAYGIPLLRFGTPAELFAAPRKKPENACFCTIPYPAQVLSGTSSNGPMKSNKSRITDHRCYLDGLMDLSLCQKGAPIAASSPHFYNADPMLAMAANMKPQRDLHETFLDIEPMTGSVFRAASRAQLNAFVERAALEVVDPAIIGNMTPMVAPLIWLEEQGGIDLKSSTEFKDKLLNLVLKAKRTFKYSILVGIILAIVVSAQYWYVTCYSNDRQRRETPAAKRKPTAEGRANKILKGRRLKENLLLSTGARKSNLAARLAADEELCEEVRGDLRGLFPTIAMAGVLGAASTGPAKRLVRKSRAPKEVDNDNDNDNDDDDEKLSKQMLVGNEWGPSSSASGSSGEPGSYNRTGRSADLSTSDESGDVDLMRAGTSKQISPGASQ